MNRVVQTTTPTPPPLQESDPLQGQYFLQALNNLLGTVRIHQDNNQLLIRCRRKFLAIAEDLLEKEHEINLLASGSSFFLQGEKVIFEKNGTGLITSLSRFFEERQLDGLRWYTGITYAPSREVIQAARILNQGAKAEEPRLWIRQQLDARGIGWLEILDLSADDPLAAIFSQNMPADEDNAPDREQETGDTGTSVEEEQVQEIKKRTIRTYGHAMHSLVDVAGKISANRAVGIGKAVHVVQNMVDLIMEDDNILLGLSTIRDYDDYTFTHSVNVAILSLCLGHRIGLGRQALETLGLCGLFHDLGKIDIPRKILNKPGKLEDSEFAVLQYHPLHSVQRIIRLRTSYEKKASILLAPFEHHLKYNLSGYPKTPRKKPISLFGRIITIADVYDAVTSNRVYRKNSWSPDQALAMMADGAGTAFDPILLKVFINMLGIYPLGTILKLDQDEMGIVAPRPAHGMEGVLWVRLLAKKAGGGYARGKLINLGKWNPETRRFNRRIVETLHPADLKIQPAEFIF